MNELRIFENENFGEVRTIEKDGKILFCRKDITKSLGFKRVQITRWSKAQGYLLSVITEVNKLDEEFFI